MVAGRASDEGSEAGVLEILEAVDWRGKPKNSAENLPLKPSSTMEKLFRPSVSVSEDPLLPPFTVREF